MRSVGCSTAARQAARLTAVVVFPTPPFWLATAMIRAKRDPQPGENLAKPMGGCKMFHVEQLGAVQKPEIPRVRSTWNTLRTLQSTCSMLHVKQRCIAWCHFFSPTRAFHVERSSQPRATFAHEQIPLQRPWHRYWFAPHPSSDSSNLIQASTANPKNDLPRSNPLRSGPL
jgi:hypothetical protein